MNIATTTEFLLLSQKVNLLQDYLNSTIEGVTLVITVLIALFVTIQFFYSKKIQRKEIDSLKIKLTNHMESIVDKKALDLQSFIEQNIKEMKDKIKQTADRNQIETARLLALVAEAQKVRGPAFYWWLRNAYLISKHDYSQKVIPSRINKATEALKECSEGNNFIVENSAEIQEMVASLEKRHKIEIDNLQKHLISKLTP